MEQTHLTIKSIDRVENAIANFIYVFFAIELLTNPHGIDNRMVSAHLSSRKKIKLNPRGNNLLESTPE